MGRHTLFFLALVLCAGAAGAVASHLVTKSGDAEAVRATAPPPRESPDAGAPTRAEWEALQVELGSLRTTVSELRKQVVELSTRPVPVAAGESVESPAEDAVASLLEKAVEGAVPGSHKKRLVALPGPGSVVGPGGLVRLGSFGKAAELMALPEEERWAKIREDLALDAWQEDELKRLAQEMNEASKKMFSPEAVEEGNLASTIGKVMELRKKTNERVKNLLSDDQYEKYKAGGYGAAMGLGSASVAISYTATSLPSDPEDK